MKRFLLPLFLLLMPLPGLCLDMQFVTYDGFQETVDAFTRLALILSDTAFMGFAATFAIFGVVCGAIMFGTKAHMGQASAPLAWTMPILFGMVVFKGLIIPTGTIYIYDPVLNANQAVGGVPDLIVFLAGGLNELEQDIVQVIDTASANPYGTSNGGMAQFNLVMSSAGSQPDDVDLGRSIQAYYADCGVWAVNMNYGGASLQELMRNTSDLTTTFAKFANPALSTTYYTSSNEAGTAVGCDAAWTSINTALNTASEMQSMENEICQKSGFNPTQPSQLAQCDSDLAGLGTLFGVTGASSGAFLRSTLLAQSLSTALQSGDFALGQSEIMNRQVMTESLGSADAMNEWIPKLRAFMTATVLGLIPLLALFMMTPLSLKALATVMGLFMWLFFWGIADATASVMMNDAATNAFAQITHYNLGYDAIMNAPEGAIKALGIYGKARGMALGLATLLSSSLMAFGGVALSSLARNLQQDYEGKGERSASQALLPEQRGALMQQLASGVGAEATMARYGMASMAAGGAQGAMRSAASARELAVNSNLAGTGGNAGTMDRLGRMDAGSSAGQAGAVSAVAAAAGGSIAGAAKDKSANDTSWGYGESAERAESGHAAGLSQFDAGRVSGGTQGGRMGAYMEVYRNVNGTDQITGEGMHRMARLFEGSHIGQSRSTPNPEDYASNVKQFADKQKAMGEFLNAHPGAAKEIGWNSEMQSLLQNEGFMETIKSFGTGGVREGYFKAGADQAARGESAAAAGGVASVARETGRTEVAQSLANARVAESVARTLGMNPSNVRDLEYVGEKRGGSQVGYTLDDNTRDATVKNLLAHGQINEGQARDILDNKRTGRAVVTVGAGGELIGGDVFTGTSTNYTSMDRATVGSDQTEIHSKQTVDRDNTLVDDSRRIVGGTGFTLTQGATAQQLLKAYHGDFARGVADPALKNAVINSYVESLGEYGHNLSAAQSKSFTTQVGGGLSAGIGLGKEGGGPSAGVSGHAQANENRDTSSSTSTNAANTYFRGVLDQSVAEGQKRAGEVHPGNQQAQNEYVARYAEVRMTAALQTLRATADLDVSRAFDRSNAVSDSKDANASSSATGIQQKHDGDKAWQQHAADVSRAQSDGPKL